MSRYPFVRRMSRQEYEEQKAAQRTLGIIYGVVVVLLWVATMIIDGAGL